MVSDHASRLWQIFRPSLNRIVEATDVKLHYLFKQIVRNVAMCQASLGSEWKRYVGQCKDKVVASVSQINLRKCVCVDLCSMQRKLCKPVLAYVGVEKKLFFE